MPKLQDIEQFKSSLRGFGNESETLTRWGESWQNLEPPPQGVPDDIAALLGSDVDEEPPDLAIPESPSDTPAADTDFPSFLDDLQLDAAEEPLPSLEAPDDDFELPDGLEAITETEEASPDSDLLESPAEEIQEIQDADDFSVPESLLQGLDTLSEESRRRTFNGFSLGKFRRSRRFAPGTRHSGGSSIRGTGCARIAYRRARYGGRLWAWRPGSIR